MPTTISRHNLKNFILRSMKNIPLDLAFTLSVIPDTIDPRWLVEIVW